MAQSHCDTEPWCRIFSLIPYRGYNQNAPTEEVAPVQNALILPQCPTLPEDVAVLSGEYCEIESPGIPEEDEDECYSEPLARRSAIGLGSTQGLLFTKYCSIGSSSSDRLFSREGLVPETALHEYTYRVDE